MDFDKIFSLDRYTPDGTTGSYAPEHDSPLKSVRISTDDLNLNSLISSCFNQEDEVNDVSRPHPLAQSHLHPPELPCAPFSAPPSQLTFTECEAYPMYENSSRSRSCEDLSAGSRALTRLGLDFVADNSTYSGLDVDWTCLDALDEQLLVSPMECFSDLCWASAVGEEGSAPLRHKKNARSCARSFKHARKPAMISSGTKRDIPGIPESSQPLVAKITLPHESFSHNLPTSSSETFVTTSSTSERIPMHFLYTDPSKDDFCAQSDQTLRARRFTKKQHPARSASPAPSEGGNSQKPRLRSPRSTSALRIVTDACTSLTTRARKSSLVH